MQLPSPWLSEITKPFSWAVLFKFSDSSVWLVSLRASNWICRSVWNVKSPVSNKSTKLFAVKRCGAYKYQRVSLRFQATLSLFQSTNNITEGSFPFNYFGVKYKNQGKNDITLLKNWKVKMKSLFYKNKLDIGVTRLLFNQVTNYSRNPLYRHLIIMGCILCP